jgi:hypothetical protein
MATALDQPTQSKDPLLMVKLRLRNCPYGRLAALQSGCQACSKGPERCDRLLTVQLQAARGFQCKKCPALSPGGEASDEVLHINVQ